MSDFALLPLNFADRTTQIADRFPLENRFSDIRPYDQNIVRLSTGQYINASWVEGVAGKRYICTQLPIRASDFWRMVYEHGVQVVVTLAFDVPYSPPVKLFGEEDRGSCVLRKLKINGRKLRHFIFKNWVDFGVPDTTVLLDFIAMVNEQQPQCLLVHCQAGVGRTGTFVGADIMRDEYLLHKSFTSTVYQLVSNLRRQRTAMVTSFSQYSLLHEIRKRLAE